MRLLSIASSSSGNCIYIGDDTTHILIDAGISKKRIEEGLKNADISPSDLDAIFVTHEHIDHIAGLGVMSRKYAVPIYATGGTIAGIERCRSLGRVDAQLFQQIHQRDTIDIGSLRIIATPVSHDAADPVCYRIENGTQSIAVMTDTGCYTQEMVEQMKNLDAILVESNHDIRMLQVGPYPYPLKQRILGERGHLSNESCGRFLGSILHDKMKQILLGHLSQENNLPELALEAVRLEVTMGDNPYNASDFDIRVAHRSQPSTLFCI